VFRGAALHYEVLPQQQSYVAQPSRRRVPLSLLLLTTGMLVAVTAVLAVVLVRSGSRKDVGASASPTATASAATPSTSPSTVAVAAGLDKCIVGTWVATTDNWSPTSDESVVATSNNGPIFRFGGDGKLAIEFGSGVTYTGTVKGKKAEIVVTGRLTYNYTAANRLLSLANPVSDVREIHIVDNVVKSNSPLTFGPYSMAYSCDGDKLILDPDDAHPTTTRRQ
jgi:hypothetical protein